MSNSARFGWTRSLATGQLRRHRAAGYLSCPRVEWACWHDDAARAERLLGWTWGGAAPFDADRFLRSHAGRSIVFVGDSLVRQQYVSLVCLLWSAAAFRDVRRLHQSKTLSIVVSSTHNLTLSYARSRFLVPKLNETLRVDEVSEALRAAIALEPDVLLLSAGNWYEPRLVGVASEAAVLEQFRAALGSVRQLLRRQAPPPHPRRALRTVTVPHGSAAPTPCAGRSAANED